MVRPDCNDVRNEAVQGKHFRKDGDVLEKSDHAEGGRHFRVDESQELSTPVDAGRREFLVRMGTFVVAAGGLASLIEAGHDAAPGSYGGSDYGV